MTRSNELDNLREMATCIANNSDRLSTKEITGFMAMIGDKYQKDLMIVGRAVNGWTKGWEPKSLQNRENVSSFVDGVLKSVSSENTCPMQWVSNSWGNMNHGYNTNRSAFWRVIRQVVDNLGFTNIDNVEWPSYLIWSNLYKCAPAEGGNPSASLRIIQFEECLSLLQKEINSYTPKHILFLTGINWAKPFLNSLSQKGVPSKHMHVEAIGNINYSQGQKASVVVAKHPQGKNETVWVDEVMEAFRMCK